MKKVLIAVMAILAYAFVADSAMAATVTGTLDVTASVAASCRVTGTANVAFATPYDPTDPGVNDSGQGSFGFRCVRDTSYTLQITGNTGMVGSVTGHNLPYGLYSDVARGVDWATLTAPFVAVSNALDTRQIYGRILAGADVGADVLYTDNVTVNVNY